MTEKDFEILNRHLGAVKPIFNHFCDKYGFIFAPQLSIGRYPRIRINKEKENEIGLWFDLWMELDASGKRFTKFFPTIPYELSVGGKVDMKDGTLYGHRYYKSFSGFANKPFNEVSSILLEELETNYKIVSKWSVEFLKAEGKRIQLGGR